MAEGGFRAQRETGNRNATCGPDSFQVTGGGHGSRPFGSQLFSLKLSEPGYQHLVAERPSPELPAKVLPLVSPRAEYISNEILCGVSAHP